MLLILTPSCGIVSQHSSKSCGEECVVCVQHRPIGLTARTTRDDDKLSLHILHYASDDDLHKPRKKSKDKHHNYDISELARPCFWSVVSCYRRRRSSS